jgi:hypothetical protein
MTESTPIPITNKYTSDYALYLFDRFGTGSSEQACLAFYRASDPQRKVKIVNSFPELFSRYAEGGIFDSPETREDYENLDQEIHKIPGLSDLPFSDKRGELIDPDALKDYIKTTAYNCAEKLIIKKEKK